jgi:hypothetical protein
VLGGIWEIAFCRAGRAGPIGPARPAGELTPRGARLVRRGTALADCRAAGPAVRIDGGALPEGLCPPAQERSTDAQDAQLQQDALALARCGRVYRARARDSVGCARPTGISVSL